MVVASDSVICLVCACGDLGISWLLGLVRVCMCFGPVVFGGCYVLLGGGYCVGLICGCVALLCCRVCWLVLVSEFGGCCWLGVRL